MALIERGPRAQKETPVAPVQEPDVEELCVSLKERLTMGLKAGMQSHEVQDLAAELHKAVDAIDAANRAHRAKEIEP